MGQGLNARDPRARRLLPANTEVLCRALPAALYGTPRHQSTSQATLTSGNRTEAPTRTPPDPEGKAQHGTRQDRHPAGRTKVTG